MLHYQQELESGRLQPDAGQKNAAKTLDDFIVGQVQQSTGFFARFFHRDSPAKGLYLYGPVGRGKTMLMDWALTALQETGVKAERWHFHGFMLEIHRNLKEQAVQSVTLENRIEALANAWADRVDVLCFDEFHVTDVADAMIMMPLFTRLFARGTKMIATSNWAVDDLYNGGLQRTRFLPFIALLKQQMTMVNVAGAIDYRAMKRQQMAAWLSPLNAGTAAQFEASFHAAAGYDAIETHELHVGATEGGRSWIIPQASKEVAKLDLAQLLQEAWGAADFMALAARYPLLFLDNLDFFTADGNEKTKRFMVMIDVLYDKNVKLVVRAADAPEKLYPPQGKLQFEFSRTISRLIEMTPSRAL